MSAVKMSTNERDWPAEMALMPWDDTTVQFTKRQLFEFLKTVGLTVDPGLQNIAKMPRYATFHRAQAEASGTTQDVAADTDGAPGGTAQGRKPATTARAVEPSGEFFRPTRKVQDAPGGSSAQIASLFGGDDDEEPVTPIARRGAPPAAAEPSAELSSQAHAAADLRQIAPGFKATRRVKDVPGGQSSMAALLAGDD